MTTIGIRLGVISVSVSAADLFVGSATELFAGLAETQNT